MVEISIDRQSSFAIENDVVVDGNLLMRERELLTIDTQRVAAEAKALASEIQAALNERNQ